MTMKMLTSTILATSFFMLSTVWAPAQNLGSKQITTNIDVAYENEIRNTHYPQLLYWLVTDATMKPERYKADIKHIANDTPFDFPFLTERGSIGFNDSAAGHQFVSNVVHEAHAAGLRLGMTFRLQKVAWLRKFAPDDCQTLISDAEAPLDGNGNATLEAPARMRYFEAQKAELITLLAFKKTADGEYDPLTLEDVTAKAKTDVSDPRKPKIKISLGSHYSGYTVFALVNMWFPTPDLFSDAYIHWVHDAVDQYKDVPLDGAALDEFGYDRIPVGKGDTFRAHFGGKAMALAFQKATGRSFNQSLVETRYVPAGHPEIRIRAINSYWEVFRKGPLRIEQEFYNYSRQVFGEKTFAGIHDTFHDHLDNDEVWSTGLNWWTIPRQYGQSDEDMPLPLRMGLLVSHPGNIMYDQFYGFDIQRFAEKAIQDARYDGRLHYHGYNDPGHWGVDLGGAPFLSALVPVERKIRLLNRFDPAAPSLPLLVVFGMPSLLNWYPDVNARSAYDINNSLKIEEKANSLWNAGYDCAVVPSDLVDSGSLTLNDKNQPVLNGHVFRAIVYLYPEYATGTTLDFLERYTSRKGALMIEGRATRDFNGSPVTDRFNKIASQATVSSFSVNSIPSLGISPDLLRSTGARLEDGSVILTDLKSLETHQPHSFTVNISGHNFSGDFTGVFALKARADGRIEKLACGECSVLRRDGKEVVRLRSRTDLVLLEDGSGYHATLKSLNEPNEIKMDNGIEK